MGLKVAMLTSWKVRCGIASYTENLVSELSKLADVYIVRVPRFGLRDKDIFQNLVDKIPVRHIDLIHVQHEYGIYMNLEQSLYAGLTALGKPIITTMHAVGAWEVDRIIQATSDKVIVHNTFCFNRFGYPEKTAVIPHGALQLKSPPPPREECKKSLGILPNTPIVGYMGFISAYKGLEMLIEAMIGVPDAGLLIGGGWHVERETEYIFGLKDWTLKALPSRCRWLGYISEEDMSRVYGAMDVVAYPSRFATESGALIMALSHGKAIVASNVAPFREKEKAGALTTFTDIESLRRKIKRLLKDEASRKRLEEGARKYAEETAWSKIATKHMELYDKVLNVHKP